MNDVPWGYLARLEAAIRRLAEAIEDGQWNGMRKEIDTLIGESEPHK